MRPFHPLRVPDIQVFGPGAVLFGVQGDGSFHMTQEHKSPRYTTRWTELPKVSVK